MNSNLVWLAAYFGLWVAVVGSAAKLFDWLDRIASPAFRERTVLWLQGVPSPAGVAQLPSLFIVGLDQLFGPSPTSWRYFLRSVLTTVALLVIFLLLWVVLRTDEAERALALLFRLDHSSWAIPRALLAWLVGATLLNALPDYLSLAKSRKLIGLAALAENRTKLIGFLVLDLLLSAALGLLAVLLFSLGVFFSIRLFEMQAFGDRWAMTATTFRHEPVPLSMFVEMLTLKGFTAPEVKTVIATVNATGTKNNTWEGSLGSFVPIGVHFYATFFASIWMAMFAIARIWVRIYPSALKLGGKVRWALNVTERPIQVMGAIVATVFTIGFMLGLIALTILRV